MSDGTTLQTKQRVRSPLLSPLCAIAKPQCSAPTKLRITAP
jgi:hypothetical protein